MTTGRHISQLILFASLLVLMGCRRDLPPAEWMDKAAQEPALTQAWQDSDHRVVCRHIPAAELAIQELKLAQAGTKATQNEFDRRFQAYSSAWYAKVTFALQNGQNIEAFGMRSDAAYQQRLHRLQQEMASSFTLRQDNGREFAPLQCEYQRTFGMTQEAAFLLAFPMPEASASAVTLVYHDREFGIAGPILFEFDLASVRSAMPGVKLSANNHIQDHDLQKPPHPQGDRPHTRRHAAL